MRYEKLGDSAPPFYRLATVEEFEPYRKIIQDWIDRLSKNSQEKVVRKLTNPRSFYYTYNELKIASILFKNYSNIEYEEELDGLTPDWIIKNEIGEILFIVEVLTRENSSKDKSLSNRIDDLWGKITRLKIGVGLDLSFGDDFDEKLLDSKLIKQICVEVDKWVKSLPPIGANKTFGNFEFKVIHYNEKWNSVQILGPARSLWVDGNSLKNNIEEKIRKYSNLIENIKAPFIVGVVPDFTTGVNKSTLEDILFGQEVFVIKGNGSKFLGRKSDGIFGKKRNLSGVIGYFDGQVEIFHNPQAAISSESFLS